MQTVSGSTTWSPPPMTPTVAPEPVAQQAVPLRHEIERRRDDQRLAPDRVDGEQRHLGLAGPRRQDDQSSSVRRAPRRDRFASERGGVRGGRAGRRRARGSAALRPRRGCGARRAPGPPPRTPRPAHGSGGCGRPSGRRPAAAGSTSRRSRRCRAFRRRSAGRRSRVDSEAVRARCILPPCRIAAARQRLGRCSRAESERPRRAAHRRGRDGKRPLDSRGRRSCLRIARAPAAGSKRKR